MGFKSTMKTIAAVAYKNRAKIETIVGMGLVVVGTGVIVSKAKQATEIANNIEDMQRDIRKRDAVDDWCDKKERSASVRGTLKYAGVNYVKTYWLGFSCVAGGLTLIGISDITMSNEITAAWGLASAYAATLTNVKNRVVADQGEEKWQEYLLGPQFETVDVMPDGSVVQTTEPIHQQDGFPPHCFFFDEANPNWEKDPYANRDFLENHQRWLNEKLRVEGFLFENDIRRDLGEPLVKSGWTSGIFAEDKDGNRNYLTFGLDAKNQAAQRFRDGIEPSILIQLNVEDNILDQLNLALI